MNKKGQLMNELEDKVDMIVEHISLENKIDKIVEVVTEVRIKQVEMEESQKTHVASIDTYVSSNMKWQEKVVPIMDEYYFKKKKKEERLNKAKNFSIMAAYVLIPIGLFTTIIKLFS